MFFTWPSKICIYMDIFNLYSKSLSHHLQIQCSILLVHAYILYVFLGATLLTTFLKRTHSGWLLVPKYTSCILYLLGHWELWHPAGWLDPSTGGSLLSARFGTCPRAHCNKGGSQPPHLWSWMWGWLHQAGPLVPAFSTTHMPILWTLVSLALRQLWVRGRWSKERGDKPPSPFSGVMLPELPIIPLDPLQAVRPMERPDYPSLHAPIWNCSL